MIFRKWTRDGQEVDRKWPGCRQEGGRRLVGGEHQLDQTCA